jgi:hypothetical protein
MKTRLQRFNDGCHKFNWLITPLTTLLMFAYFLGGLREEVKGLNVRLSNVEQIVFGVRK